MSNEVATKKPTQFDLSPQNFEQALTFANYLADSELVPKDFKGKPGNCLVAIQWGMEIGLKPMQALQNIAVINGRPALWGDSVIALVRGSAVCEYIIETQTDDEAVCKVKRRGEQEQMRSFSRKDAHAAGLLGKQGPWTQYPKRMMQMRARAFALRDVFPDVLKGLPVAEEVMDIPPERHMGAVDVVATDTPAAPATWPDDAFEKQFPKFISAIQKGKTSEEVIAWAETKGMLTDTQKAKLREQTKMEAAPAISFADVADKLNKAADQEALYAAADLISAVREDQRGELNAIYDRREQEIQE